jgi:PPOX class probable F420-dependent enzyme
VPVTELPDLVTWCVTVAPLQKWKVNRGGDRHHADRPGQHGAAEEDSIRSGSCRGSPPPVTGGVDGEGRIVISTYPDRAKAVNLRRNPAATVLVHSDDWDGPYVQIDGSAEVLDMPGPATEDALVEYFRCIAGEHPDWDEYRAAMRRQGKSLIRITIDGWGPVAAGGFPPDRAPST